MKIVYLETKKDYAIHLEINKNESEILVARATIDHKYNIDMQQVSI